MSEMIRAAGSNVSDYQGNDASMLPVPATFIVGADGSVKVRHFDPDHRGRMSVGALVDAFRSPPA